MILGAVHVIAALSCATLEVGAQGKEIHRDIERIRVSKINVDEFDRDNHPSHRQTLEPGWVWLLRPVSEEPLVASAPTVPLRRVVPPQCDPAFAVAS